MDKDIKILKLAILRANILRLFISSMIFCLGLWLIFAGAIKFDETLEMFLNVLGILLMSLSIYFLISPNGNFSKVKPSIIETLKKNPQKIVWIYHVIVINKPFGIEVFRMITVVFKMVDGSQHSIMVPYRAISQLFKYLKLRLPHATFGYSSEKTDQFDDDPRMMIKN